MPCIITGTRLNLTEHAWYRAYEMWLPLAPHIKEQNKNENDWLKSENEIKTKIVGFQKTKRIDNKLFKRKRKHFFDREQHYDTLYHNASIIKGSSSTKYNSTRSTCCRSPSDCDVGDFEGMVIMVFVVRVTDSCFKFLFQSPDTNCDLDPIPTSLLKQCSHILL